MLGTNISKAKNSNPTAPEIEITLVSKAGFWILIEGEELFLSYADFPWFKAATIEQITNVEYPGTNHLYWPALDIDLSIESVRRPDLFPLIANTSNH